MVKKIIQILIVAASVSVIGCAKDPSNVAPLDQLDNTTYPKTLADLETFLVPGYSNFRTASLYGFYMLPIDVLCSDHTACMTAGGASYGSKDFATNTIGVNNTVNAAMWSGFYEGVLYMNVFMDRANYFEQHYGQTAAVEQLRGQALFLRSYYLMQLECFYGEKYIDMTQPEDPTVLGVPLPTVLATTIQQSTLPRSSAYQVWSQIIKDLKTAATVNLAGVPNTQGKVNQWAADALLGKAYVFTKQYDSAKVYLSKVINNSGKTLMPFSEYADAFNGDPATKFNSESLFEIDVERQPGDGGILFSANNALSETTEQGVLWGPSILGWNGSEDDPSCLNVGVRCQFFVHDKNLQRFGFDLPVPVDTFTNPSHNPAQPSSALSPAKIEDPAYQAASINLRVTKAVDPRLYVCALQPWVDSCGDAYDVANSAAHNGGIAQIGDSVPVSKYYNIAQPNKPSYYGWSFHKYVTTDNSLYAYGLNDGANLYLLRLADVYLLYAEACIAHPTAGADATVGVEYINKVHRRAYGLDPNTPNLTVDYTSSTSTTKAASTDVDLYQNPLAYERFTELFGEGNWWFDVCRWGIGANEAAYYVTGTSEDPNPNSSPSQGLINVGNWSSKTAYCYPIPSAEISANGAMSAQINGGQNPGY